MGWSNERILVTGGAGFLGSHLVDGLLAAGAKVRVLDNLHGGTLENLSHVHAEIEWLEGDVRDAVIVRRAAAGCAVIFHLAANASVPDSVSDPVYDFETNVTGTFHVLRAALEAGCRRIVFTSSAAVYGPPLRTPVDEAHPLEPISPYGGTKLAAERLLAAHARTFGIEVASARVFNTYGPRQRRYVASDLLVKLRRDPKHLEVLGDGSQRRDYCYVSDTVEALMLLARVPAPEPIAVNIAGGGTISIRDLVARILALLDLSGTEVIYGLPSWKGDIDVLWGDIARIRGIGFEPRVTLDDGLGRLIRWFEALHGPIGR
jgi:UDP-glucose 4-epimerase